MLPAYLDILILFISISQQSTITKQTLNVDSGSAYSDITQKGKECENKYQLVYTIQKNVFNSIVTSRIRYRNKGIFE
jgi:hypothetical protein